MSLLDGKKILIVGLARSGLAAAEAAAKLGAEAWGYDAKPADVLGQGALAPFQPPAGDARLFLGGAEPSPDERWDCLVLSPGVPVGAPLVAAARAKGAEIIGELEFAWRIGRAGYVAVTGTNGKTTTTTLIGQMMANAGMRTEIVGNIGIPAASKALLGDMGEGAWMVAETSSFQLETICSFHPRVSVVLNITPDHMDRHKNMENYAAAKARIFENQGEGDFFVVNRDDPAAWALAAGCAARVVPFSRLMELGYGVFVRDGQIVARLGGASGDRAPVLGAATGASDGGGVPVAAGDTILCGVGELIIPGAHNLENALAAAAAAICAGAACGSVAQTLREFKGVEHRLEPVAELKCVRFVNDSKGTNPGASIKALEAMGSGICLIAGGYDKSASFDELAEAFEGRVKMLALMGKTAGKIAAAAEAAGFDTSNIAVCQNMEECVAQAFKAAGPGDTVLLSPACASWDMYSCFEERGEDFKKCVEALAEHA
jgi:UDP-N-acetylmuramoylalanine--D-glutamate ligase